MSVPLRLMMSRYFHITRSFSLTLRNHIPLPSSSRLPLFIPNHIMRQSSTKLFGRRLVFNKKVSEGQQALVNELVPEEDKLSEEQLMNLFIHKLTNEIGFEDRTSRELALCCKPMFDVHFTSENEIDFAINSVVTNFEHSDIIHNPQVFAIHPRTLNQRIETLREIGFDKLKIAQIDSVYYVHMEESPERMKLLGLYPQNRDPLEFLCQYNQFPNGIIKAITKDIQDSSLMKFNEIRQICSIHFLSWKLECSLDVAKSLVQKKTSRIMNTSCANMAKQIDLLVQKYRMPFKKIISSSFLITCEAHNTEVLIKNIDKIAGKDFSTLCKKYPTLVSTKYSTLIRNLSVLRDFDISDEQILSCVQVLTLSPETLRVRMHLLEKIDEFRAFRDTPRALRIVMNIKAAFDRLEQLHSLNVFIIMIDYLVGSKKYFESVLLKQEYPNEKKALIDYIKKYLGLYDDTENQLDTNMITQIIGQHPFCTRLKVSNANKIVEYFTGVNLTKEQIMIGINIVLYDYEFVKIKYKEMCWSNELQPFETDWQKHPYLLQLLVYYIEKDYSFTGNGVFIFHETQENIRPKRSKTKKLT